MTSKYCDLPILLCSERVTVILGNATAAMWRETFQPLTTSQLTSPAGVGEMSLALGFAASTALRIAGQLYRGEVGVSEIESGGAKGTMQVVHCALIYAVTVRCDSKQERLTLSQRQWLGWRRTRRRRPGLLLLVKSPRGFEPVGIGCSIGTAVHKYYLFGALLECSERGLTGLIVAHGH
jgi:hypothetical protein